MTPAPLLFDAPDDQGARQMLEKTLPRLARGGRKLAALCGILLCISLIVPAFRHLRITSPQEISTIVFDLLYDFAGLIFVLLIVWTALPGVLRKIYAPLLNNGCQPFMVRGALETVETLMGGWLPTRAVNFRRSDKKGGTHIGFLFSDETLTSPEAAYALFDPFAARRNWLIRYREEKSQ
jgi:hypothetical protein